MDDFAVFILTHGRPDNVITYASLQKHGYTGRVYLIVDNEDKAIDEYLRIYGDKVIVFDKLAAAETTDAGDNFDNRRSVLYARNASFEIAQSLGLRYFLQLDDDYKQFVWKFTSDLVYKEKPVKSLDRLFAEMIRYYQRIPAATIALAQNGDFIGGGKGSGGAKVATKRKAMNTFFCSTERPFEFMGRLNDDVNTYVAHGNRGKLLLTVFNAAIIQMQTQQNTGGLTAAYLDYGTYVKSFYTVMYCPSCVKVSEMGDKHRRIHHKIRWNNAVPCIVGEQWRKSDLG